MDGPLKGQMRKDGKLFQEPYAYQQHYEQNQDKFQGREGEIYRGVLKTCRYFIRLRYSLMQLLYDAMFENMLTGLPIARAMVIPSFPYILGCADGVIGHLGRTRPVIVLPRRKSSTSIMPKWYPLTFARINGTPAVSIWSATTF